MEKVSSARNYAHKDIHYHHEALIRAQTKMFNHFLTQFNNGQRKYNSTDGILDIPKIKLYDKSRFQGSNNGKYNIEKVQQGGRKIRQGVKKFLNSKIVRHCCIGAFANFEHTVYRPVKKNQYKQIVSRKPYVMFHPHVHITFITKKHKGYQLDPNSMQNNHLYDTKVKPSQKIQQQFSHGDCVLLNKEWNKDIHAKYNHFYLKPTYIKSNNPNQHVHAYWSAGWGNYSKSIQSPFTYAKPNSKSISDNTSLGTIHHVAHDLANESNKYRGTEADFIKQLEIGDYNGAKQLRDKYGSNIAHGMIAVEMGWYNHLDEFPRHMYTGALHQYAQQHIFPKFPQETLFDKLSYLQGIKSQPYNALNPKEFKQSITSNLKSMLDKRDKKLGKSTAHHDLHNHNSLNIKSNLHKHSFTQRVTPQRIKAFRKWLHEPNR